MGRLLTVHPCPVCNYHVEGELHEGGSGSDAIFLRNHYALAICTECRHLVSVLVANTDSETEDALKAARSNIVQMEADAVIGDLRARYWLPFFRDALDRFDAELPGAISSCSMCGSHNIDLVRDVDGERYDNQSAWIPCPKCEEGRLLIETSGAWA